MNEPDRTDLRGLGLPRNCEAAEAIARRIISCYQGGALKYMIGYYKSAAVDVTPEARELPRSFDAQDRKGREWRDQ